MTEGTGSAGDLHVDIMVSRGAFALRAQLTAPAGQVTALVGPNGSGKSTLLRAVAGLEVIDAGEIRLGGVVLDDGRRFVPPEKRSIGMVFQDYLLFPHLSVIDNITFGLLTRGFPKAQARERSRQFLEELGLLDLATRKPTQLSGGQAQRVALARALVIDPSALLLDEPLAALDAGARADLRVDLAQRLREITAPTLLVTHEPLEALVLADRLCVLEDGRVVQSGTVAEVVGRPVSTYVAKLMGINLLRGRASGNRVHLSSGGDLVVTDAPDGEVLLTIRPSAVTVHREQPSGSARNVWRAHVDGMEEFGDRVRIGLRGAPSLLADLTTGSVAALGITPGSEVWLSVKATEIDVYSDPGPVIKT
jgi:molybdate transport system ATP-binding protein